MGMFDSVYLKCPKCGNKVEAQSKAGDCILGKYSIHNAPPEILLSLKDDKFTCIECGSQFTLKVQVMTQANTVLSDDLVEDEYNDD